MNQHKSDCPKRFQIIAIFLLILLGMFPGVSHAHNHFQYARFGSSPNPVGSGARALGMGGAFIAVADDATAASWNPAGLIQLEVPEISFVTDMFHRTEDNTFGNAPEASGPQSLSETSVNYLSAAYPFSWWNRNMVVSVNYQKLYDFNQKWTFPITMAPDAFSADMDVDYRQTGNLSAIGLAWCVRVSPQLSLGITLNIWNDGLGRNEWEQDAIVWGSIRNADEAFTIESRNRDRYSFSGMNANIGILWRIGEKLTLGAVLKTPFKADLEHEYVYEDRTQSPESTEHTPPNPKKYDETMDMPMSYGIGLAYQVSHNFMVSCDVYRTEWEDFVLTDHEGRSASAITGEPDSDIDPTHQVRMGAEYLFITPKYIIPLCMGMFYDPAPAEGSPDDFFGFSIGSGFGMKCFHFDLAYQYRFGNNAGHHVLKNLNTSQDVEEHTVYSSVIIHF